MPHGRVHREDRRLGERLQRGLASPSYAPGPLSNIGTRMTELHELVERHIPEVRLAAASRFV